MTANDSIKLTDMPCIAIVESYQREIGDKTAGRTLTRIIQAFHASGGRLLPESRAEHAERHAEAHAQPAA